MGLSQHLQALARMPSTLNPELEILGIARAYDPHPHNPEFRFRHYFQNVIGTDAYAAQRKTKPPGVDELTWRGLLDEVGGEHNADGLWPVPGDGFKTLSERARVQVRVCLSQIQTHCGGPITARLSAHTNYERTDPFRVTLTGR